MNNSKPGKSCSVFSFQISDILLSLYSEESRVYLLNKQKEVLLKNKDRKNQSKRIREVKRPNSICLDILHHDSVIFYEVLVSCAFASHLSLFIFPSQTDARRTKIVLVPDVATEPLLIEAFESGELAPWGKSRV